jgi:choline kinase
VLNCDVLFHPQLLSDLLLSGHDAALMLEYRRPGAPPLGEEEMKVRVRAGRVVEMGKSMEPADADGESAGMVRFGAPAVPAPVEFLDGVVASGGLREWAPRACPLSAERHPLRAIGTRGFPWIEVDFSEDYERPAIARAACR